MKKILLPLMWVVKTTCDKASDRFQVMGMSVLHRIDAIDGSYADKRWVQAWTKCPDSDYPLKSEPK